MADIKYNKFDGFQVVLRPGMQKEDILGKVFNEDGRFYQFVEDKAGRIVPEFISPPEIEKYVKFAQSRGLNLSNYF